MSGFGVFVAICMLALVADGTAQAIPAADPVPCRFTLERGLSAAEGGEETWVLTCHRGPIAPAARTVSLRRVATPGPALVAD
jgi:hypothetical protein